MKKFLAILLSVILILPVLSACAESTPETRIKTVKVALSDENYAFAVSKNNNELLKSVNEFLSGIKEDGRFNEICDHFFGEGKPKEIVPAKRQEGKDQLIVATATGFEPFEMVENGVYSGIDIELAQLLAEYLGKDLVIDDMPFDRILEAIETGECHIGMAAMTVTADRKEIVSFSDPYYKASQVLIVRADDNRFENCKTKDEVERLLGNLPANTKIGCQTGTTGEVFLDGDLDDPTGYGFTGVKCDKKCYTNIGFAVAALMRNELEMVIVDNAAADAVVESKNTK